MTTPTPQTWTLRLKSHRTTVLLHADPLASFATLKAALHSALTCTDPHATEHSPSITLPTSPDDIKLARAIDPLDPGAGFRLGEWEVDGEGEDGSVLGAGEGEEGEEDVEGKGKGKAKAKANPASSAGGGVGRGKTADNKGTELLDCPKGAGLKDGAVLAFRWVGDGLADGWEDGTWGVQIASFEDAYGVQNEGDVGARGEFDG